MLTFLGLAALFLLVCFSFVLLFGAPYLPTLSKNMRVALDMVDLRPGQTLLELGCGDGKVLVAAAQRGWRVIGYELNPLLVLVCWWRTRHYRKLVSVRWGNFWRANWPAADGIFVFVMQRHMGKLDKKIMQLSGKPVKLVSFAFAVPGKQPIKKRDGVYLYEYR